MTKFDFSGFNFFGNSSNTSKKRADKQRRGRQCRIEELEGREMLSVSPWTIANDQFDYGDTILVDTNTQTDQAEHDLQALAAVDAKYTEVKGLKQVKGVKNSAMTLSTITLQFNAVSLAAETDTIKIELTSGKKATLKTYNLVFAKDVTAVNGWKVVDAGGLKIDEAKLFKFYGVGSQDPTKATGKTIAKEAKTLYTLEIGGLEASTKYAVKSFQSFKDNGNTQTKKAVKTNASTLKYAAVKKLKATVAGESVNLTWTAHPNTATSGYEIWMLTKVKKETKEVLLDTVYDKASASVSIATLKANALAGFIKTGKDWKPTLEVRAKGEGPDSTVVKSLFAKKAVKVKKDVLSTALDSPTNFAASISGTTATLAWDAVKDATGYEIRYRAVGEAESVATWDVPKVITDGAIKTDDLSGLAEDKMYLFEIKAVKDAAESVWVGVYAKTKTADVVLVAPSDLNSTGKTSVSVSLSWTAPDTEDVVLGYEVQYTTGSEAWKTWEVSAGNTVITETNVTITELEVETEYQFQVRTVYAEGTSAWTPALSETTVAVASLVPNVPTGIAEGTVTSKTITLSWTAPAAEEDVYGLAESYEVQYKASKDGTWTTWNGAITGTSVTITELAAETAYQFQVRAVNAAGESDWAPATPLTVTTAEVSTVATNFKAAAVSRSGSTLNSTNDWTSVELSWTPVDDAAKYKIEWYIASTGAGGDGPEPDWDTYTPTDTITTADGNVESITIDGFAIHDVVWFRIIALNAGGSNMDAAGKFAVERVRVGNYAVSAVFDTGNSGQTFVNVLYEGATAAVGLYFHWGAGNQGTWGVDNNRLPSQGSSEEVAGQIWNLWVSQDNGTTWKATNRTQTIGGIGTGYTGTGGVDTTSLMLADGSTPVTLQAGDLYKFAFNDDGQPSDRYTTNVMMVDKFKDSRTTAGEDNSDNEMARLTDYNVTTDSATTTTTKDGSVTITWKKETGDLADAANYRFIVAGTVVTPTTIEENAGNFVAVIDGLYANNFFVVVERFANATLTGGATARSYKNVVVGFVNKEQIDVPAIENLRLADNPGSRNVTPDAFLDVYNARLYLTWDPLMVEGAQWGGTAFWGFYMLEWSLTGEEGTWRAAGWGEGVERILNAWAPTSTFVVFGDQLRPNTTYYLRLIAETATQKGKEYSNVLVVTTSAVEAPTATDMTGLKATTTAPTAVTLAWDPVDGNNGTNTFHVQYKTGTGEWTYVGGAANPTLFTGTTATVTGLTAGTSYDFRIEAVCLVGGTGTNGTPPGGTNPTEVMVFSNPLTGISTPATLAAPGAVSGLTMTSRTDESVVISWSAPTTGGIAASYNVQYRIKGAAGWTTPAAGTITYNGTTAEITGLTAGEIYEFQVQAVNGTAVSGWESAVLYPSAPANFGAIGKTNTSIAFEWDAATEGGTVLRYEFEYRHANELTWSSPTASMQLGDTSVNITGLYHWSPYLFRVRAVYADGYSDWTATLWHRTNLFGPEFGEMPDLRDGKGVPKNLNAAASGMSITLSWNVEYNTRGPVQPYNQFYGGISNYTVEYRAKGSSSWDNSLTVIGTKATISVLSAGEYEFRVKSNVDCTDTTNVPPSSIQSPLTTSSDWSEIYSVVVS